MFDRTSALVLVGILAFSSGCASEPRDSRELPPSPRAGGGEGGVPTPPAAPVQEEPSAAPVTSASATLDAMANEIRLRDQERAFLAEHYFKVGKELYFQLRYAEAAKNFEHAVDEDPNHVDAREYLARTRLLLGDRKDEAKTLAELMRDERLASIDQQKIEIRRLSDEGERLLRAHEWQKAIERFEVVLEKIRWFPYHVDEPGLEEKTRSRIVEAKQGKRQKDEQDRIDRERRALERARSEQSRVQDQERSRTSRLAREGQDPLEAQRSAEAVSARRRESRFEDLNQEGSASPMIPADRTVAFPDREKWNEVQRRGEASVSARERPEWVASYEKKLSSQRVSVRFDAAPLSEVVSFLQDVSGLNFVVSSSIDSQEKKVTLRLRDVALEDALALALGQAGLARVYRNEAILIVPRD